MPQAVTHILIPILVVSIFRDFFMSKKKRKNFPLHYALIAGLGGVLPDIDIPISMLFQLFGHIGFDIHRTFTHSLLFPLIFLAIFLIAKPINAKAKVCNIGRHKLKLSTISLMLALGILIHILLDASLGDQSFLFYPFLQVDLGINIVSWLPFEVGLITAMLDGILLVLWLLYLELKHKISDFV